MTPDDFLAKSIMASAQARTPLNALGSPAADKAAQDPAWREQRDRLRAALGKAPQIAALQEVLANERPSYFPGMDFAQTAYHEGRKAALRDLLMFLTAPENA
jgi:hypothetical protein